MAKKREEDPKEGVLGGSVYMSNDVLEVIYDLAWKAFRTQDKKIDRDLDAGKSVSIGRFRLALLQDCLETLWPLKDERNVPMRLPTFYEPTPEEQADVIA